MIIPTLQMKELGSEWGRKLTQGLPTQERQGWDSNPGPSDCKTQSSNAILYCSLLWIVEETETQTG